MDEEMHHYYAGLAMLGMIIAGVCGGYSKACQGNGRCNA